MNRYLILAATVLFFLRVTLAAAEPKPATDVTESPLPITSFMGPGTGQLWLPPNVTTIRGVIIVDGVGHGNRIFADTAWRETAQEQSWAMLFLKHPKQRGKEKQWSETGGGEVLNALKQLIATLSRETKHPELENAPWAIWGHSAGGAIAFLTMLAEPGRFFACLPYHGAVAHGKAGENKGPFWQTLEPAQLQVPTLYLVGSNDIASITSDTTRQFQNDRAKGGRQAYVTQPGTDHLGMTSTELQLAWLVGAYRQRVPADWDPAKGLPTLRDLPEAAGWLGNATSRTIAPFASFAGNKAEASWLLDEAIAKLWLAAHGVKR